VAEIKNVMLGYQKLDVYRPTTSTGVHVHDHDDVHDDVSRRRGTFFQPGNFTAGRHL
jgi:hypothetical protein